MLRRDLRAARSPLPDIRLVGRFVVLRTKRIDDARRDFAWRRDEELARHDAAPVLTMSYESFVAAYREEYIGGDRADIWARYRRRFRLAIDTLDECHIGNITLYDIDHDRRQAELGIMIGDKSYWSQGLGRDAIITLLFEAFARSSLNRIYLHTLDWNARARQSFARAGFHEVGWTHENRHRFVEMETRRDQFLRDFRDYFRLPPLPGSNGH